MTQRKKAITIIVLGLVCCSLFLALVSVRYSIREGANGDLVWNGHEAYLFLDVGVFGYRPTYLQYIGDAIKAFFDGPIPATNKSSRTVVFRLTQSGVEQYNGGSLLLGPEMAPIDDIIYVLSDHGLMKWSSGHFLSASPEERSRFDTRTEMGPDFRNLNGWSRKSFIFNKGIDLNTFNHGGEVSFEVVLNGTTNILTVTHREHNDYLSLSWGLQGQTSNKIWELDQTPRRVNKSEYDAAFL